MEVLFLTPSANLPIGHARRASIATILARTCATMNAFRTTNLAAAAVVTCVRSLRSGAQMILAKNHANSNATTTALTTRPLAPSALMIRLALRAVVVVGMTPLLAQTRPRKILLLSTQPLPLFLPFLQLWFSHHSK
jgi:hypothetical protein